MKKKKLKLENLEVQSFVTSDKFMNSKTPDVIAGGGGVSDPVYRCSLANCVTEYAKCPTFNRPCRTYDEPGCPANEDTLTNKSPEFSYTFTNASKCDCGDSLINFVNSKFRFCFWG